MHFRQHSAYNISLYVIKLCKYVNMCIHRRDINHPPGKQCIAMDDMISHRPRRKWVDYINELRTRFGSGDDQYFFPSLFVFLLVLLKHFVEVVVAVLERADRHVQVVRPRRTAASAAPVRAPSAFAVAVAAAVLPRGRLLGDHFVVGGEERGSVARAGGRARGRVVPVVPREDVRVGVGGGGGRRGGEEAHVAGRRVSLAVRRVEIWEFSTTMNRFLTLVTDETWNWGVS